MADEIQAADSHAVHAKAKNVVEHSIFCANCQAVTGHKLSVQQDRNGHREIVATCDCGRALKFPGDLLGDRAAFDAHLQQHHGQNAGVVSAEAAQAEADAYDERFLRMIGSK